jgi:hypothetical protein
MKKAGILAACLLLLFLAGLFSACGQAKQNAAAAEKSAEATAMTAAPPSAQTPDITPASPPVSAAPPSASGLSTTDLNFTEKTYTNGTVTIKYPQLTGMTDSAAQEKLNKIISDAALRDLDSLKNESDTEYELNYMLTYKSPNVISIYFDGYMYAQGAAHPNQFLYSVSIDVTKQKSITLKDLVKIDESFVDMMLSSNFSSTSYDMTSELQSAIKDELVQMDTDSWIAELNNADSIGTSTFSYLTDDALVISVSVPHVMGDHVEIQLKYKDLTKYKTDNPLWKAIEN